MNCNSCYYFSSGMLLYQLWIITAIQSAYLISANYLKQKLFKSKKAFQTTNIQNVSISIYKKTITKISTTIISVKYMMVREFLFVVYFFLWKFLMYYENLKVGMFKYSQGLLF